MSKRLQIPVSSEDEKLIKSVAKTYKISAAEWARRVLRKAASRDLATTLTLDPQTAVQQLASLNAPVADVQELIEQSIKGRLK
jgi:hypothetical protein